MPEPVNRRRKSKNYNTRLVKRDFSYSVEEVCALLDVHSNTVRSWIRSGLETIDEVRPTLIHGSELKSFLTERQSARKRKCDEGEFYCCRCRAPRRPWGNLVDIVIIAPKRLLLKALCEQCETRMNRMGVPSKRGDYEKTFEIQTVTGGHIEV